MKKLGFWEAFSIGVGGMIGGGIFAVLGLTILLAKGSAPIAFLFAGLIALLTSYSYAKLSVRFPSEGGTVEFLVRAFGNSFLASYLNLLLLASYIIMLSLYSYAFGSYASALLVGGEVLILKKFFIAFVIIFFTVLNFLGAYITGKAEDLMVFGKIAILIFFSIFGFLTADFSKVSPENWESLFNILTGGLIIFLAYEGFELIANTGQDIENPERNLPLAYYSAVITVIVIYFVVSIVAVCNLTYEEVQKYQDYALAVASEPFLGKFGFVLIGIAAVLSTASAINATLYGSARVSYMVAKFGALPKEVSKKVWKNGTEGLLIIAIITIFFATIFNIENISIAGSLGFLLVFSAVNYANYKLYKETKSNRWISFIAFILCVISIIVLISYNLKNNPDNLISSSIVIVGAGMFELVYRTLSERRLKEYIDWRLEDIEKTLEKEEEIIKKSLEYLKEKFKEAEIYIHDRTKSTFPHIKIFIHTEKHIDTKKEEKNLKKHLNLKEHFPIKIEVRKKN